MTEDTAVETDFKINLVNLGTERGHLQTEKMIDITLTLREYHTTTEINIPVTGINTKIAPVTTEIDIPVIEINTMTVPRTIIILTLIQVLSFKDVKFPIMIKLI